MKNLSQMMKQAQEMQTKMAEMQESLAAEEVTGQAGGGMVRVTLNGKYEMRGIKVDGSLISDPSDLEVMEDLIVAAHNDAKAKVEARIQEKMSELTGGLQLPPGLKLPF